MLQKMNILITYGGLSALLVVVGAIVWSKAPVSAIAFIVSIIIAFTSLAVDLLDAGRLDPLFLMSMTMAWFLSLMVGLATGWVIDKGWRARRPESDK